MLALKDINELWEYNYRICEISGCEAEATDFYESDIRSLDLCHSHHREVIDNENLW